MSFSFNDLKRSNSGFDKLNQELNKLNSGSFERSEDTRFWKPTTDKSGNGYAVIRFLPPPAGEDVPFVRIFSHGFQGPGGWYIENSLTTFGNDVADPIAEMNRQLWNTGIKENQDLVRARKRRLNFYSNIYVVNDPANKDNNGKVFLFKYGKKIFDKLNDLMNPSFEDEKPINPFDLWNGANFKLKVRKFEGYPNYDKSEFESPGPLLDDDSELERVWNAEYSLQELLDKKHFKTYDELKSRLDRALGHAQTTSFSRNESIDDDPPFDATPTPQFKAAAPAAAPKSEFGGSDVDDDDFELFKKLAEED